MNMSRSKKRTPVCGMTAATSEKQDKRKYNRRYRRACNVALQMATDECLLPLLREQSNIWAMDKDGKNWFDAKLFPELMRK